MPKRERFVRTVKARSATEASRKARNAQLHHVRERFMVKKVKLIEKVYEVTFIEKKGKK